MESCKLYKWENEYETTREHEATDYKKSQRFAQHQCTRSTIQLDKTKTGIMHLRGIRSRTALRNFAIPCPVVNPLKRGPEMASFFQLSIDHHQPDTKGLTKQVSQNGTSGTSMVKYPDTLFAVYSTPSSRERPGTQVKKLLSEQKVESRNAIKKKCCTHRRKPMLQA